MTQVKLPALNRRDFALSLATGASLLLNPNAAFALRPPSYGGHLRLSLPLGLRSLDPYDPTDLGAALFGPSLFEPLYQKTSSGLPYPTLAAQMPVKDGARVRIDLRPHLRLSSGAPLTAIDVAASLNRAKSAFSWLSELGEIGTRSSSPDVVWLSLPDVKRAALLLSSVKCAVTGKIYDKTRPVTSGALRVKSLDGVLRLERNPFAPRGGSYLEQVTIQSRTPLECLRDFEAHDSHLGYFGAGLHQLRRDVVPFTSGPTGLCLVLCGSSLKSLSQPGAMNESLRYLPDAPFSALGVERPRADVRPYRGQDFELLVSEEDPWMKAVAAELKGAWSTVSVKVSPISPNALRARQKAGNFDALLLPWATSGLSPEALMNDLFFLSGRKAPQGGRVLSVEESLRQLSIGLLGTFHARGALSQNVRTQGNLGYMDLSNATLHSVRP